MQKIITHLWFNDQAEQAVNFYMSIFKNSKILNVSYYGEAGAGVSGRPEGSVMSITFQLEGQEFMAINGGPEFIFTPAISLFVKCNNQAEVDELWEKFTQEGKEIQCGWLTDKFGLSWQIVPTILGDMLNDVDREKAERAMKAMLKMKKLDINRLKQAFNEADTYERH